MMTINLNERYRIPCFRYVAVISDVRSVSTSELRLESWSLTQAIKDARSYVREQNRLVGHKVMYLDKVYRVR